MQSLPLGVSVSDPAVAMNPPELAQRGNRAGYQEQCMHAKNSLVQLHFVVKVVICLGQCGTPKLMFDDNAISI